jgi:tRNA(Ile)-lysidine synthase
MEAVLGLIRCTGSSKQVPITDGLVVRKEYGDLVIGPAHSTADFHIEINALPADILLPRINARVRVRTATLTDDTALKRDTKADTVYLAAGSIKLPLIIRSWKAGDYIRPFGSAGKKKVKAVFAEKKIPVRLRACIPVVESNGRIISIGTLCIAEHCRVTLPCREVIAISITFGDNG